MTDNHLQLLERLGHVEPPDPEVLARTASMLADLVAADPGPSLGRATAGALRAAGNIVALPVVDETATAPTPPTAAGRRGSGPSTPQPVGSARQGARRRARRRVRWAVRVAAAVAVIAVAAGAGIVLQPGSPAGPGAAAASAVLEHLADVAAAQPAPGTPGPGQFFYVESVEAYTESTYPAPGGGPGYTALVPEDRQIWVGPDGSGRLLETYGQPVFLSAAERAKWEAAGSPPIPDDPTDVTFGPGGLSGGPNVSDLPTDPNVLASEIESRKIEGGPPGPAEDFTQVGDLLRETDASPALRSALYQVAAGLPGVQLLGTVADHSGRRGIGIAYTHNGARAELIFDPNTSALLGEQYTVVDPASDYDVPPGTVVGWAVYQRSGVVDSTTSVPRP